MPCCHFMLYVSVRLAWPVCPQEAKVVPVTRRAPIGVERQGKLQWRSRANLANFIADPPFLGEFKHRIWRRSRQIWLLGKYQSQQSRQLLATRNCLMCTYFAPLASRILKSCQQSPGIANSKTKPESIFSGSAARAASSFCILHA